MRNEFTTVGLTAAGRRFLDETNQSQTTPPKLELPVPPEIEAEEARTIPRRMSGENPAGVNASQGGATQVGESQGGAENGASPNGGEQLSLKQVGGQMFWPRPSRFVPVTFLFLFHLHIGTLVGQKTNMFT